MQFLGRRLDSELKLVALMFQALDSRSESIPFGSSLIDISWNGNPFFVSEFSGIEKHGTPSTSVMLAVPMRDMGVEGRLKG